MALTELYQEDRELVRRVRPTWRGYVLSGWWRRAGAALLDTLVLAAAGFLFAAVFAIDPFSDHDAWWTTATAVAIALAYFPTIMRATDGQTLGKMATRIRVVRADELPMSFARAAWREVASRRWRST